MNLAVEAGLPKEIMSYLISNNVIANLQDLRRITPDEVQGLRSEYDQSLQTTPDQPNLWTFLVTSRLRALIEWINSYHRTYGHSPPLEELTSDNLETLPEEKFGIREPPDTPGPYGRYSMSPARNNSYVTSRRSYGSMSTANTQHAVKRRNVKVSITEYPKFSGKAKDWIVFERKC